MNLSDFILDSLERTQQVAKDAEELLGPQQENKGVKTWKGH